MSLRHQPLRLELHEPLLHYVTHLDRQTLILRRQLSHRDRLRLPPLHHQTLTIAKPDIEQRLAVIRVRHLPILVEEVDPDQLDFIPAGFNLLGNLLPQLHDSFVAVDLQLDLLGYIAPVSEIIRQLEDHQFPLD